MHSQAGETPALNLMEEFRTHRLKVPVSSGYIITWKYGHFNFIPFIVSQTVARKVITKDNILVIEFTKG